MTTVERIKAVARAAREAADKRAEAAAFEDLFGPDGEDGPWAPGWEERAVESAMLSSSNQVAADIFAALSGGRRPVWVASQGPPKQVPPVQKPVPKPVPLERPTELPAEFEEI